MRRPDLPCVSTSRPRRIFADANGQATHRDHHNACCQPFASYNHCDLASFARYIAPNIHFYHDKSGLTVGRSKLVSAIRTNIFGKLRRVLVPGTLAVYPIPGYGTLETGDDQFCELRTGNCNFFSEFSQLWHYRHGTWQLTIVFSYDHHTGSSTDGHAGSRRRGVKRPQPRA